MDKPKQNSHMHASPRSNHREHAPCPSPNTHSHTCMHRLAANDCEHTPHSCIYMHTYMHCLAAVTASIRLIHAHLNTRIHALLRFNTCLIYALTYMLMHASSGRAYALFMHSHAYIHLSPCRSRSMNISSVDAHTYANTCIDAHTYHVHASSRHNVSSRAMFLRTNEGNKNRKQVDY